MFKYGNTGTQPGGINCSHDAIVRRAGLLAGAPIAPPAPGCGAPDVPSSGGRPYWSTSGAVLCLNVSLRTILV
jgi:hypothetical protein